VQYIDASTRAAIVRVSNVIKILAHYYIPIGDTILIQAYSWVVENDYDLKDLLYEEVAESLVNVLVTV
jgi:exosome complex component RRP4